mmetsp:Transcript_18486/g.56496  ORF Transcript_18486/g.56496 Transcript_18486/m.56496 type:complete len:226 (+) Transcript_18486:452-1129(+)
MLCWRHAYPPPPCSNRGWREGDQPRPWTGQGGAPLTWPAKSRASRGERRGGSGSAARLGGARQARVARRSCAPTLRKQPPSGSSSRLPSLPALLRAAVRTPSLYSRPKGCGTGWSRWSREQLCASSHPLAPGGPAESYLERKRTRNAQVHTSAIAQCQAFLQGYGVGMMPPSHPKAMRRVRRWRARRPRRATARARRGCAPTPWPKAPQRLDGVHGERKAACTPS